MFIAEKKNTFSGLSKELSVQFQLLVITKASGLRNNITTELAVLASPTAIQTTFP